MKKKLKKLWRAVVLAVMMVVVVAGITLLVTLLHSSGTHSKPVVIHSGSFNGRT